MAEISYQALSPETLAARRKEITRVYSLAFKPWPYFKEAWEIVGFSHSLLQHMKRRDFRFITAQDDASGDLLGFAYGFASLSGQNWHDLVAKILPEPERRRWLTDSFQVAEFAVRPQRQGQGIGGRLHDLLLEGLPHRTAVLSTMQGETPAFRLYRQRGWQVIYENLRVPGLARVYQIMGLELERSSPAKH